MLSKWTRRGAALFVVYLVTYLVILIKDSRHIIDHRQIATTTKKISDGPLIVKDQIENLTGYEDESDKSIDLTGERRYENLVPRLVQPMLQKVPVIDSKFFENFKREATIVHSKSDDFLLFTLINAAYLNLTLNWLCNVAPFRTLIHQKTLIVSLDEESCKVIQRTWKEVKCLFINVDGDYNGPLNWGRQNYINLLNLRSQLLLFLVQLELPYILFETDAIWLRDPMEFFQNQTLIDDADIIVPIKGYPDRSLTYTFDPMIVYPSNASLLLMRELNSRLSKNPKAYDQSSSWCEGVVFSVVFNFPNVTLLYEDDTDNRKIMHCQFIMFAKDVLDELCRQQSFGLVCRQFEWAEVADGKWFKLSDSERAHLKPYIVNNNYYVGVDNKISRQALNGLWFLSVKGKCNLSKVRKLLHEYEQ